ncbi:hypothetical protein V6N13_088331 [Hibiscus sabdariffa]
MATVCSVRSIENRLHEWGLEEIKVQRLGGKSFLLSFEDDELFMMLEDLNWSYLKDIFMSVKLWSENMILRERVTWVEVVGVPIHCWNHVTLRRIVELWGNVEAFGENLKHIKDCEKMSILITTESSRKIDEVVELEVGNVIYRIHVVELGFSDSHEALQKDIGDNVRGAKDSLSRISSSEKTPDQDMVVEIVYG